jgi:hypothetical protein
MPLRFTTVLVSLLLFCATARADVTAVEAARAERRWNVAANPLAWLFGVYGASLSYAVHPRAAVHADVTVWNMPDDAIGRALEASIGLPYYSARAYHGFFFEPGVRLFKSFDEAGDRLGVQTLVGAQWSWDSGVNVALAIGPGVNLDRGAITPFYLNGYLRFGYSF